jgi:3-hydroxyacyl-[acyl-carrier-protein] dehydratase
MSNQEIIAQLPYSKPFLFVDEIIHIDENGVEGNYTFDETSDFYKGHFKDYPVTPGVILTEVMAQIGLVCLGIYLLNDTFSKNTSIALTSTEIEFLKPVFPNEKVIVISEKIYFRFGKLKCKVIMKNEKGEVVCTGIIAGMIVSK